MALSRDGSSLVRVSITLPANLLREIDRVTADGGRSRFIAEAAARRLRHDEQARALRESEAALADSADQFDPVPLADWLDAIRRPRS
jgi:metal-responsive CopG/Arc/MetJ family transcriptional regulator